MIYLEWTAVVFLFIISLMGVVLPFMPDTLPLWLGFLLYRFTLAGEAFPVSFWLGMIIISAAIIGSDVFTNMYFVKRSGGSKWSMLGAAAGLFLGTIILGPPGVILGPLLVVFLITYLESGKTDRAFKTALAVITALFSSAFIKVVLQLVMIAWFFLII